MRKAILLSSVLLISIRIVLATEISGPLTGTLPLSGSPYQVVGDIWVPVSAQLVIEPGVVLDFQGNYSLAIYALGNLTASGTESDSIRFTCDTLSYPERWEGIICEGVSTFRYCVVEFSALTGIKANGVQVTVSNSAIRQNGNFTESYLDGSGLLASYLGILRMDNCIISDNRSSLYGGGIFAYSGSHIHISSSAVSNNAVSESNAGAGGGIAAYWGSTLEIDDCTVEENVAPNGGGIAIIAAFGISEIRTSQIDNNLAIHSGGAFYLAGSPSTRLTDCEIRLNAVTYSDSSSGGAVSADDCGQLFLIHSIVADNTASIGPGMDATAVDSVAVEYSVLYNNYIEGGSPGAGLACDLNSSGGLINSIVWNNWPAGNVAALYSDIMGGWEGEGNIDTDPLFRDPSSGDFHLMAISCGSPFDSPCIDAGSPLYRDDSLTCDWGLGERLSDIGVYSGGIQTCGLGQTDYLPGDVNGNLVTNGVDVTYFVGYLKGIGPPPIIRCWCDEVGPLFPQADVNSNCQVNGVDITYLVNYFKGLGPPSGSCPHCPPQGR